MSSRRLIVRGSFSPRLTCHWTSSPANAAGGVGPRDAVPFVPAPLPWATIVAPHLRHRILTILPWTFSSATLYLAWQDWQVIFMWPEVGAQCTPMASFPPNGEFSGLYRQMQLGGA